MQISSPIGRAVSENFRNRQAGQDWTVQVCISSYVYDKVVYQVQVGHYPKEAVHSAGMR